MSWGYFEADVHVTYPLYLVSSVAAVRSSDFVPDLHDRPSSSPPLERERGFPVPACVFRVQKHQEGSYPGRLEPRSWYTGRPRTNQSPPSVLTLIWDNNEMTIHLSKDQERFVHDVVRAGLYASEAAVVSNALDRLRQTMPKDTPRPGQKVRRAKAAIQKKSLSPDELNRRLLASGLVSQLPDLALDIDDDDVPPIVIKGDPLSETIIRERW
jgi:Arc/MetJ-type ribon-helix-helix transcriptional regulator